MEPEFTDLYTILGVSRGAAADEIEAAFSHWNNRADAGETIGDAQWERLRYAYDVLSSPSRRAVYDSLVGETAGDAPALDMTVSAESLPLLDTAQLIYALLTLKPGQSDGERRPLNIGLVVDRSTSMRGERLQRVTAAVELLLNKLAPDDILSVVSFSDRAEVVLPAARVGSAAQSTHTDIAAAWSDPRRTLRTMSASGGTEIYHGLRAALNQVTRAGLENHTSHLILLTDGHTYGDANDCLRLADEAAGRGIGLTAFGLGADWNDAFLDALVAPSGGQSHFIESPAEIMPYLEGRLQGLSEIYARNLTLQPAWPESLSLRGAFKLAPFPQPLPLTAGILPLGDLEGRSPLMVLLEFLVAPQSLPARFRLTAGIQYTSAGGAQARVERAAQLMIGGRDVADTFIPTTLVEAVQRLNLYRMQERAWEDAQSGKLDTAAARMRQLTARYMETGDLRLARQAQLEAQQLAHLGAMSAEGHKLLKYGTRSLMGQLDS
ncbi:MAG: VWA domain-containing protein [Candidatus Promineofilum sp.]|nr:VWA domain-containing protein [Promineifilum sp.]